mmetsp:Transcript_82447/g.164765  ORF Transcript_82447/g.164765 Transcript_82447/m.164765 type:complete len:258 (-) Transcript_82447:1477-2250(-)
MTRPANTAPGCMGVSPCWVLRVAVVVAVAASTSRSSLLPVRSVQDDDDSAAAAAFTAALSSGLASRAANTRFFQPGPEGSATPAASSSDAFRLALAGFERAASTGFIFIAFTFLARRVLCKQQAHTHTANTKKSSPPPAPWGGGGLWPGGNGSSPRLLSSRNAACVCAIARLQPALRAVRCSFRHMSASREPKPKGPPQFPPPAAECVEGGVCFPSWWPPSCIFCHPGAEEGVSSWSDESDESDDEEPPLSWCLASS